jgi:hypothetical protein
MANSQKGRVVGLGVGTQRKLTDFSLLKRARFRTPAFGAPVITSGWSYRA